MKKDNLMINGDIWKNASMRFCGQVTLDVINNLS